MLLTVFVFWVLWIGIGGYLFHKKYEIMRSEKRDSKKNIQDLQGRFLGFVFSGMLIVLALWLIMAYINEGKIGSD